MKKILLALAFTLSLSAVDAQELEGRWVNLGLTGEENSAYSFLEGNIIKMYYGGMEIPTKEPVKYTIAEEEGYYRLEMAFFNKMNSRSENLVGRLEFLSEDEIKLEFWQRQKAPAKFEFTEEATVYTRR
jgi:hypothetical protein